MSVNITLSQNDSITNLDTNIQLLNSDLSYSKFQSYKIDTLIKW